MISAPELSTEESVFCSVQMYCFKCSGVLFMISQIGMKLAKIVFFAFFVITSGGRAIFFARASESGFWLCIKLKTLWSISEYEERTPWPFVEFLVSSVTSIRMCLRCLNSGGLNTPRIGSLMIFFLLVLVP